ncbi:hypothetical protein MOBT1_001419 [Malassezia obtusa]|uniref:TEA domain-containing protein n=1 Tax=Malassezia obtusa TaxID=76774 RepID=A0AAF0IRM7_9BASI|nr:hypothetical protein MOBT1_001419 [Malassezia obtusa]
MSPPYMQRMSGLNAPGLVESPKPFAQPPSTDGKRRRTSPAMQPMMSPVQPGPQGNEPDLAHMGQPFMHQYPIGLGVHQTPPNTAFCFSPNMLSMPIPETPTSVASAPGGLLNQQNNMKRKASTDVWPDDVEVAFWEALRLIPKLGRRKVLVHGKPCGRNELIADYIERKTNKTRSRKQVSSHIQVLKNVKRNDPEFQQLIAEPAAEEDYYTPAGGMMYAQPLADYSSGLLGVSLLSTPNDAMIVPPSPLSSAALSPNPNLMSPLSAATGAIANALDNLHFGASPKPMLSAPVSPQLIPETTFLSDIEPVPMVVPASFSISIHW